MSDEIAKQFDNALTRTIDMRAAYKSKVDSLRANIRAAAELGMSQRKLDPKAARKAEGELTALVDASVALVLEQAREGVAKMMEKEMGGGAVCPPSLVPDVALTPFIGIYEAKALGGIKAAFA